MSNYDLDALFGGFTAADALEQTESKKKSFSEIEGIYKPSYKDKKCKDQVYRAVIRFIPYIHDGKIKTTYERWESYFKDVNGENGIYVISPKTIGDKCPLRGMSYKLYNSENAFDKNNSKKINVYQQWYAIIEVVSDKQHPEYEGKHFIYQFGSKIHDKIVDAERGTENRDAINPFDFYKARTFEIILKKDNKKMDGGREVTDYDSCGFLEKTAPIHFTKKVDDEEIVVTLDNTTESKRDFVQWLETDAPQIKKLFFKPWDAETTEKVNRNLATYASGYQAPKPTVAKAKEIINDIETPSKTQNETPAPVPEKEVVVDTTDDEPQTVTEDDDEWVNSILNG